MAARQCLLATDSFTSTSRKFCGSVTVAGGPLTPGSCVLRGKRMRGKAGGLQAVSWAGVNQGAPSHFEGKPVVSCHPQVNSRRPAVTESFLCGLLATQEVPRVVEGSGTRELLALMSQLEGGCVGGSGELFHSQDFLTKGSTHPK